MLKLRTLIQLVNHKSLGLPFPQYDTKRSKTSSYYAIGSAFMLNNASKVQVILQYIERLLPKCPTLPSQARILKSITLRFSRSILQYIPSCLRFKIVEHLCTYGQSIFSRSILCCLNVSTQGAQNTHLHPCAS